MYDIIKNINNKLNMLKKSKMYRIYEQEEKIIIARLVKEIKKQKKSISKSDILKLIIQESK